MLTPSSRDDGMLSRECFEREPDPSVRGPAVREMKVLDTTGFFGDRLERSVYLFVVA